MAFATRARRRQVLRLRPPCGRGECHSELIVGPPDHAAQPSCTTVLKRQIESLRQAERARKLEARSAAGDVFDRAKNDRRAPRHDNFCIACNAGALHRSALDLFGFPGCGIDHDTARLKPGAQKRTSGLCRIPAKAYKSPNAIAKMKLTGRNFVPPGTWHNALTYLEKDTLHKIKYHLEYYPRRAFGQVLRCRWKLQWRHIYASYHREQRRPAMLVIGLNDKSVKSAS